MTTVPCKELKNRLGAYLKLVRSGETIQITDHGNVVACILPAGNPSEADRARLLAALAAKGSIEPGRGPFRVDNRPSVMTPGKTIAEMISEDRR